MEEIAQYFIDFQKRKLEALPRELKFKFTKEFISVIVGARRVGKTYFLFNLINQLPKKEEVLYVDFELPQFLGFKGEDLKKLVNLHLQLFSQLKYVFFDEIQAVVNWEAGLRELYEEKKYFIVVTGSSAKLLSKEIATQLRGRVISYKLFPFSLREILKYKGIFPKNKYFSTEEKNRIVFQQRNYLTNGGFPQVFFEPKLKEQIIKDYKDVVLFRDLVERHKIRDAYIIKRLFECLISSFSKEISLDKFFNFLKSQGVKVSKKTLYQYLDYLEDSLFFMWFLGIKQEEPMPRFT